MSDGKSEPGGRHDNYDVAVSVITPSGIFPCEDTLQRVPAETVINTVLQQAAEALELTNTGDWVVRIDRHAVDAHLTFKKANLRCIVDVIWQPREGGGGA